MASVAIGSLSCGVISRQDGGLKGLDDFKRQIGVLFQRWDNRLTWPVDLLEKYAGGALSIIIKFERVSGWDIHDVGVFRACGGDAEDVSLHSNERRAVRAENCERGMARGSDNGSDDGVLVRIVQSVEGIKSIAPSSRKNFKLDEKVFHPITGCFYSFARGFVINPVISRDEAEVSILRAVVQSDDLPRQMIEGGTNIVDSVAYYEGETLRRLAHEPDSDYWLSGFGIVVDHESVRFRSDVCREFGLKIADVMIGPFDL